MIQPNIDLSNFCKDLFLYPKDFFRKYIGKKQPPFFALAFIVFGIGYGIDQLDRRLSRYDLPEKFARFDHLNIWGAYWINVFIGGIIGGFFLYLIGGWFFNVRLIWSKGTSNISRSRYIYLYSGVISSTAFLITSLISMFLNDKPYKLESKFNLGDFLPLTFILFFLYYSVYVSYCGVKTTTDADKIRGRIWFLILPMVVYTIVYLSLFVLVIKYIN